MALFYFDCDSCSWYKNSNCDKTQIATKLIWLLHLNSNKIKTQIVTKLKNSKCDEYQKLKLGPNFNTQIATKLKYSNCDTTKKSNCDKTQIATKLKYSNSDTTQKLKLGREEKKIILTILNFQQNFQKSFATNNLTPRQPMRCTLGSLLRSRDVYSCANMTLMRRRLKLGLGFYNPKTG